MTTTCPSSDLNFMGTILPSQIEVCPNLDVFFLYMGTVFLHGFITFLPHGNHPVISLPRRLFFKSLPNFAKFFSLTPTETVMPCLWSTANKHGLVANLWAIQTLHRCIKAIRVHVQNLTAELLS